MRAFIAIELPDQIKAWLGKVQNELGPALPPAKWVEPQNLHLTMLFLGDIDETKVNGTRAAIKQCALRAKKIETRLAGLGCFPDERNPQVLFAQLENEEEFIRLYQALCTELKIIPEKRFKAHITLCRFKAGEKTGFADELTALPESAIFTTDRLTLFKSTLSANGPAYETIFSTKII